MNGIAIIAGYTVIWPVVATVIAVILGKALKFLSRQQPEPEDWEPAPRSLAAPLVPPQWQRDNALRDPTPSPHDPAS